MKTTLPFLAIAAFLLSGAGCSSRAQQDFSEKRLVIPAKQTVSVKELDLTITNNGCGRQWVVDKDKEGYERPYCELLIRYKDSALQAGDDFKPVFIGPIQITLDRINPWGREEDSIPPGGCRVRVRRIPGR